jgi:hypothetical protein
MNRELAALLDALGRLETGAPLLLFRNSYQTSFGGRGSSA